jgi:hypothetical protein
VPSQRELLLIAVLDIAGDVQVLKYGIAYHSHINEAINQV